MKLKNLIKKQNKGKLKNKKTFHTSKKIKKKPTRADQKSKSKTTKRAILLTVIGITILGGVLVSAAIAYVYNSYVVEQFSKGEIVSPGKQFVFEVSKAREVLSAEDININSLEYSSKSGVLTLITQEGSTVYFSDKLDFNEQVKILSKIIYSLKVEERNAKTIDLRYNRPIVKF